MKRRKKKKLPLRKNERVSWIYKRPDGFCIYNSIIAIDDDGEHYRIFPRRPPAYGCGKWVRVRFVEIKGK